MSGSIDAWQGTGGATGGLAAPTMEPMALRRCRRDAHSCRARSSWVRVVSAARSRWKCARSARASSRARSAARRAAVSSARRAERASASCMALVRTCSASIVWEGAGVMCSGGEGACAGVRRGRGAQRLMGGRGKGRASPSQIYPGSCAGPPTPTPPTASRAEARAAWSLPCRPIRCRFPTIKASAARRGVAASRAEQRTAPALANPARFVSAKEK